MDTVVTGRLGVIFRIGVGLLCLGLGSCGALDAVTRDSEPECVPNGGCRTTYLSRAKSGTAVMPDGALGLFALSVVSMGDRGTLQLTFYRIKERDDTWRVRSVKLLIGATMNEGRAVDFKAGTVSLPVTGQLEYFSYAASIPIEVRLESNGTLWTCGINLENTRTFSYSDALRSEPAAPKSVAEFLALPAPTPNPDPAYPHPVLEEEKVGCRKTGST